VIELTVTPNSNDVVPVRDQIVEIDIANSNITVTADGFVGGSSDAGVGYTTTSSY
jgi:predicted transposase YbfD/YdcC